MITCCPAFKWRPNDIQTDFFELISNKETNKFFIEMNSDDKRLQTFTYNQEFHPISCMENIRIRTRFYLSPWNIILFADCKFVHIWLFRYQFSLFIIQDSTISLLNLPSYGKCHWYHFCDKARDIKKDIIMANIL